MTIKANFPTIRPSLNLDFANTKVLDPRITFSRASTATYYDGKTTVKAEENLLTYSQDFDNATWTKGSLTISANTTVAPDGTTTAETMTDVAATSAHFVYKAVSTLVSVPYTASVYVKQGAASYVIVGLSGGNLGAHWAAATVNLGTGSITQTTNGSGVTGVSSSIVSVGSGWYLVTVTATSSEETAFGLMLEFSDTATPSIGNYSSYSYLGTGSNTAYIWGAQLEQRSTVTAYTPTTSAPITNSIPALQTAAANVARFDHDPVTGESKGMLIEEQRTNLLTYSEFQKGVYTAGGVLQGTMIGPTGGTVNAAVFTSGSAQIYILPTSSPNLAASTTYAVSVFVKMDDGGVPVFNGTGNTAASTNDFVLIAGNSAVPPQNTTAQHVGNGLYRVSGSVTTGTTNLSNNYIFRYSSNSGRGFKVTGWQIETGAFPTSYIPTTSAQVTRSADSASITGSNFTSISANGNGTLYMEFDQATSDNADRVIAAVYGTSWINNAVHSRTFGTGVVSAIYNGATAQGGTSNGALSVGKNYRLALAFAPDDMASVLSGGSVATDTTVTIPSSTFNTLDIGGAGSTTAKRCGTIKRIAYYPKRLSNTELKALTA